MTRKKADMDTKLKKADTDVDATARKKAEADAARKKVEADAARKKVWKGKGRASKRWDDSTTDEMETSDESSDT